MKLLLLKRERKKERKNKQKIINFYADFYTCDSKNRRKREGGGKFKLNLSHSLFKNKIDNKIKNLINNFLFIVLF